MAAASAATVGAVVIGGLAVGALIGTALRQAFGTARAVRAEEAAAAGGLALHRVRVAIEARTGRPISAPASKALFQEYEAQLRQLGFTQDARGQWRRERSALERFLG